MICKNIFLVEFLNEPKRILLLNGSNDCDVSLRIQLNISHLFTHS